MQKLVAVFGLILGSGDEDLIFQVMPKFQKQLAAQTTKH